MSQFFASGGQSIGASTSASVLPMNIQACIPLRLTGLISLQSKGLQESKSLLQPYSSKASIQKNKNKTKQNKQTKKPKSINSWMFSFIYGPTLTSTHDY